LQQQLPRDADRFNTSGYMLERYLDNLTSYAETVYDDISTSTDNPMGSKEGSINPLIFTSLISNSEGSDRECNEVPGITLRPRLEELQLSGSSSYGLRPSRTGDAEDSTSANLMQMICPSVASKA